MKLRTRLVLRALLGFAVVSLLLVPSIANAQVKRQVTVVNDSRAAIEVALRQDEPGPHYYRLYSNQMLHVLIPEKKLTRILVRSAACKGTTVEVLKMDRATVHPGCSITQP